MKQIDKYQLISQLGEGAFGAVFLANDCALNTQKAIKILNVDDADDAMKKLEEAQILYKCKHKNIVHVNEANIYNVHGFPRVIIDMEFLSNGSLEGAIKSNISIHTILRCIVDCLFALEHAHLHGILHRDIKPANIMLTNTGAKLSDFGLATILGLQGAGSPRGYITHLAPEYFTDNETTILTDIFAMGITLFRACNYINNWDEAIYLTNDIQSGTLVQKFGFSPIIPLKLKKIINKACNPNPDKRYQSASEFRQDIDRLSFGIDWILKSPNSYKGICQKTGASFSIEVISHNSEYSVEVKKNNRRKRNECMTFNNEQKAHDHLHKYVSSTLFV